MLSEKEIKRILAISFFGINQNQYEKYQEKIDLIVEIGNCLLKAEYNARGSIIYADCTGKEYCLDDASQEKEAFISEGVKNKYNFFKKTGYKYDTKDVLKCLDSLEENELIKNFAKGLAIKQEPTEAIKVELQDGKYLPTEDN
jgi:hypothetical protein